MLSTLVIALREGVEASLIVGIVAAFLVKEGRRDALRQMWIGVAAAIAVCAGGAVALRLLGEELPHKEQEGLEAVIAVVAVVFVTYMIVWMRRHSRGIKRELEGSAARAIAGGSALGLVAMAFLAVLREGFETAVFLLAVFQDSTNTTAAGAGAVIGLAAAVAIGVLLYRGGVRIDLARFFRFTALVLVLVAAGLLSSAAHAAYEAGWITGAQGQVLDLGWLIKKDTVPGALLTGMFGVQPEPTVSEVIPWLLYAIPMSFYVLWPDRLRRLREKATSAADAPVVREVAR